MRSRSRDRRALAIATLLVPVALSACRKSAPPFETFGVTLELPTSKNTDASPPQGALRPWRVWVNQEEPRQKKAPEWRSFGAKDGAVLDLAADGKWRCIVNPVRVRGRANEQAKTAEWVVSRTVRCSSDGWSSHVEAFVEADFDADGKEVDVTPSAALRLNDVVGGAARSTVVVLEGEKTSRRPRGN
jgi:hypothetical protein